MRVNDSVDTVCSFSTGVAACRDSHGVSRPTVRNCLVGALPYTWHKPRDTDQCPCAVFTFFRPAGVVGTHGRVSAAYSIENAQASLYTFNFDHSQNTHPQTITKFDEKKLRVELQSNSDPHHHHRRHCLLLLRASLLPAARASC